MSHHHLHELLDTYGYWAVFLGSLLEGETVLLMAGFAAHRALLKLPTVIALGAAGGFIGDQIFFTLGRYRGRQMLARFPSVAREAARVQALIERHSTWLIIGVRFMYGLRIAGPMLIGMSAVSHLRFAMMNAVGAILWVVVITGAGYLFGQAVEMMLHDMRRYELFVLVAIAVAGALFWVIRRARAQS
jgi:membrane protein DedA with SNARE-associated domain